jgi:hypothetical protein
LAGAIQRAARSGRQIKTLQFMGKPISALQTLQQWTCGDRAGRFDLQKNLFIFAFHVISGVGGGEKRYLTPFHP